MAEFTTDNEKMLKRHDEMLRGNGEIGLRAEVKNNTDALADIKDYIRWLLKLVGAVIALQILALVMNM